MAELGSIEYNFKVNDQATPDLNKIIESIKAVGRSVDTASAETKTGFSSIGAAIASTEQTIQNSNKGTIEGLNLLATVMQEVKTEITKGNQALAENGEVLRSLKEEKEAIKEAGEEAEKTTGLFSNLKDAAQAMGIYFGVQQILDFSKSVLETRKSMQSLRASFNTLLGDEQKASKMFEDLNEFATSTPLQLEDLAKASQTMLGFGIESEKILPTLKNIGDISQGDAGKLQSLTLAFSQMTSTGKLMGQDLLQMINAGFNPLEEMSRKTGKSIAELKDEMSKGAISAEMVADAFRSATEEGGKFHDALKTQSETMAGAISNFEGAVSNFKDELGSIVEGPLVDAYNAGTKLLAHYQELATALGMLVAALGAYKAAVVVANAITKVNAILKAAQAYGSLAKAIQATATAQKALNLAKSLNVWGLLAAGIAAATVALVRYNSESERTKRLNEQLREDEAKAKGYGSKAAEEASKEDTKVQVDIVFDKDGEKTVNDQAAAYNKLIAKYKELGKTYKNLQEMKNADRGDVMAIIATNDERAKVSSWQKQVKQYTEQLKTLKTRQATIDKSTQAGAAAFNAYAGKIEETQTKLNAVSKELADYNNAVKEAKKAAKETEALEAKNKTIDELKAIAGDEEADIKTRRAALDQLKALTKDKQAELEKQVSAAEKAAAKEAAAAKKQAEQQRKQQNAAKVSAFAEQLNNDIDACDRLIDKLDVLQKARNAAIKAGGEVGKAEQKKTDEALNSILNASIKSNTNANKDEEDANDDRLTEEERYTKQYTLLVQERQVVELTADEETRDKQLAIYDNYLQELETRHRISQQRTYDQTVDNYGTLQERLLAIDKSYQDSIDAANAKGDTTTAQNLTTAKNQDKLGTINAYIQQMPVAKEAFKDLQDVSEEALKAIKKNLEDTAAEIKESPETLQGVKDKIAEISDELNNRNPLSFSKQLKELEKAKSEYEETQKKLKQLNEDGSASAEDLQKAIDADNEANKRYQKALKKTKAAAGEWGQALGDLSAELSNVGSQMDNVAGKSIEIVASVLNVVSGACSAMEKASISAASAIRAVETASVILAIISAVIQAVEALNNALTGDRKTWEDIAETFDDYINTLDEVIDKEKEALETLTGTEATQSYNYIKTQLEEEIKTLREAAQARANYKKEESWWTKNVTGYTYSRNFQRWANNLSDEAKEALLRSQAGKKVAEYAEEAFTNEDNAIFKDVAYYQTLYAKIAELTGDELEDIKKNSTEFWASLDDDYKDYLQDIIDSSEELNDTMLSYYESLTDVSFDSLKDEFFDALSDMDTSAADFAENFTEYMRKAAIKNQLFGENGISKDLESWYKQFAESLEGDQFIDATEKAALEDYRDEIYNRAKELVDTVNDVFDTSTTQSALSGAISTASQESIDLLAGQTNAVRINQVTAIEIMREQLIALTNINTTGQQANTLLDHIDRTLQSDGGLRAGGL